MCRKLLFLASLFVVVALVSNASGQASVFRNWTDANDIREEDTDGDWFDPCNWEPNGIPGVNDSVSSHFDNYQGPGIYGVPLDLHADAGTIGHFKCGSGQPYGAAGLTKAFIRGGAWLYVDNEASASSAGDLLVAQSTGVPGRLVISGGSIGYGGQIQCGKRANGYIHMAADDVNDPGGDPFLFCRESRYIKLGGKNGGTGTSHIQLDNGLIRVDGIHFYRDEATMDIAGGTIEVGDARLGGQEEYYPNMGAFFDSLYYDKEWLTCYGGAGELDYIINAPADDWITAWCEPRDPLSAAFPSPKKRADAGPYDAECPEPAGSDAPLKLSWDPGATADEHQVYLSDIFEDVNSKAEDANKGKVVPAEFVTSGLSLSTSYYWRVVEYNDGNPVATGPIWTFNVPPCLCIDNFESYDPAGGGLGNWSDDGDDADITLSYGEDYADAHGGTQSLNLNAMDYWADLEADAYLDPTTLTDWTYGGAVSGLVLWHKVPLYATHAKIDINGNGFVDIATTETMDNCWHEANITFAALGGGLDAVSTLTIRIGVNEESPPFDTRFDDIAVCDSRCVPDLAMTADLDNDCDVDGLDLEIMGQDWLMNDLDQGHYDLEFELCIDANGPHWVYDAVKDSNCLYFDGENDFLNLPEPPLAHFHDKTIAVWVNRAETLKTNEETGYVFRGYDNLYRTYFGMQTGRVYCRIDGMSSGSARGTTTFAANEWHHLAFVIRDQDCTGRSAVRQTGSCDALGYLDGVIEVEAEGYPLHSNIYGLVGARIGNERNTGENHAWAFHGKMLDYRIYDYALTQDEVNYLAEVHEPNTPPDDSKLLMYFPMNQDSGTTVNETSALPNYLKLLSSANLDDAEATGSRSVNFKDYSVLANQWGTTFSWP